MSRIELTDSAMDVFMKMSDGNPGAISAMMDIHQNAEAIDPQAMMGGARCYHASRYMGNIWFKYLHSME